MTAPLAPDLVRRYVELGLRLGRHNADIVDSYYGPTSWRDLVDAEPVTTAQDLVEEARRLILDLDADASAADHQLDTQRRHWLRSQTVGLHTVARMLHGDRLDFIDEVELCFGIRPERITEDEVRDAQRELDGALRGPGGGAPAPLADAPHRCVIGTSSPSIGCGRSSTTWRRSCGNALAPRSACPTANTSRSIS